MWNKKLEETLAFRYYSLSVLSSTLTLTSLLLMMTMTWRMLLTRRWSRSRCSWLLLSPTLETILEVIMTVQTNARPTNHSSGVSPQTTTRRNIPLHVSNLRVFYRRHLSLILIKSDFSDFHLVNKSLPWDYAFRFVIEEISNINDKAQTMSISMYFAVSWLEPRLQINTSATEWTEDRTGPLNVSLKETFISHL